MRQNIKTRSQSEKLAKHRRSARIPAQIPYNAINKTTSTSSNWSGTLAAMGVRNSEEQDHQWVFSLEFSNSKMCKSVPIRNLQSYPQQTKFRGKLLRFLDTQLTIFQGETSRCLASAPLCRGDEGTVKIAVSSCKTSGNISVLTQSTRLPQESLTSETCQEVGCRNLLARNFCLLWMSLRFSENRTLQVLSAATKVGALIDSW